MADKESKPLERVTELESALFPDVHVDGPVHYIRLLWEERKAELEYMQQSDIDAIDALLLRIREAEKV